MTFQTDGDGGRVLSINLTIVQLVIALLVGCLALYAGVSTGIERIGTSHIRTWWVTEGEPEAQVMIDKSIKEHRAETEVELQRQLAQIERELGNLAVIAESNHEQVNRLLDAVLADRKARQ